MIEPFDIAADDQDFLDSVLDRAIHSLEEGHPLEADIPGRQRPDLRHRIDEVLRLAQEIALGPNTLLPSIPGYTVLAELGHGGMGAVYLARQQALGDRSVALKVLPPSAVLSPVARKRFVNEANAIAKLRHPNIVAVYDVVHERGLYAYAMEWVEGKSLALLIDHLAALAGSTKVNMASTREFLGSPADAPAESAFPIFVCRLCIAIARALAVVHEAGLLHRDVKPSNILLRRDGTPLLSDFGLARETDSTLHTEAGRFAGTPAYAPPEQLRGDAESLDVRSDVYALGVTLYHALALRLPFQGNSPAQLLRNIEAGKAEPLRKVNPKLPADMQTIVDKAMDPDADRRYQTADELADDLERLLNLQPIRARPASVITRTFKLYRRNRRAFVAATVASVASFLLAVALGVYVFIVPRWVRGHLDEARFALLDPNQATAVFNAIFFGQPSTDSNWVGFGIQDQVSNRALASYDAALRLGPTDTAIRLERDILRLARDFMRFHRPADANNPFSPSVSAQSATSARFEDLIPRSISEGAPLAADYIRRWSRDGRRPVLDGRQLLAASPADLRSAGLLAFLLGDVDNAMPAWSQLDLVQDPDPLVEALLGEMYLVSDQPARAYPRLRNAAAAYPELEFLTTYLADAALQCGDLAKAEQLLNRARNMQHRFRGATEVLPHGEVASGNSIPMEIYDARLIRPAAAAGVANLHPDPTARPPFAMRQHLDRYGALERVQADLYAATGRDDLARERYEWSSTHVTGAPVMLNYARFLEKKGEFRSALLLYLEIDSGFTRLRHLPISGKRLRIAHALVAAADRWWGALADRQRGEYLRVLIEEMSVEPPVRISSWNRGLYERGGALDLPPTTRCAFDSFLEMYQANLGVVQSPPISAPVPQCASLRRLVEGLDLSDRAFWRRLAGYPAALKDLQAAAWLMADPDMASSLVEGLNRVWQAFRQAQIANGDSSPQRLPELRQDGAGAGLRTGHLLVPSSRPDGP